MVLDNCPLKGFVRHRANHLDIFLSMGKYGNRGEVKGRVLVIATGQGKQLGLGNSENQTPDVGPIHGPATHYARLCSRIQATGSKEFRGIGLSGFDHQGSLSMHGWASLTMIIALFHKDIPLFVGE
jgi:hypothetical protein